MVEFENDFQNHLINKRDGLTPATARSYISYLRNVTKQLHGVEINSRITSIDVVKDFVFGLKATGMPEGSIQNCNVALRAYLRFLQKFVFSEKLYPEQEVALVEGASLTIKVNRFERSVEAREACVVYHGATCKVCQLNFFDVYGDIGKGFIHVHHITPLSDIKQKYKVDPINDLVPVCPNCHAMLHRKSPPYSVVELRAILRT